MGEYIPESAQQFEVPKECFGAVVKNEGPDFYVEVEKLPVPEIGTRRQLEFMKFPFHPFAGSNSDQSETLSRARRCPHQIECDGDLHVRYTFHAE
jgi:hypothetical protein